MFKPDQMGEVVNGHTIHFVRIVKHSPERVWRAISDGQELAAWLRYPGERYGYGMAPSCCMKDIMSKY